MRKQRTAIVALIVLAVGLAIGAAQVLVVKVQTTQLRRNPQFFGPALVSLKAGDKLEKMSEANGWVQVKTAAGAVGWIHSSAVTESALAMTSTGQNLKTQATANEVALAGRGFNKQVEDSYKAKHAEVSFVGVDRMVQIRIGMAELEDFLRKGRLGGVK
jgi:SH3-like domain-containing protein